MDVFGVRMLSLFFIAKPAEERRKHTKKRENPVEEYLKCCTLAPDPFN